MKTKIGTRRFAGILTGLTFLVVGVTGVLMFFHVKSGTIVGLHEWLGICFLVAAGFHLAINWRSFASYLNSPAFWIGVVVVGMACALALAIPNDHGQRKRGNQSGYGANIRR